MNAARPTLCFHCGEPLAGSNLRASIDGAKQPVCCVGCLAVAELIQGSGLSDFYKYRAGPTQRPMQPSHELDSDSGDGSMTDDPWSKYAQPTLAAQFVQQHAGVNAVNLLVDGLRCSACSWLLDKSLHNIAGVCDVSVNMATARVRVEWTAGTATLALILRTIARFGFGPHPIDAATVARVQRDERRAALKRLAIASFGMMQVMMFAVAIYTADINHEEMDAGIRSYFRIVSLLVATPVTFYAGWPFFRNAYYSLRAKTIGMDVPVSIALILAYAASANNALRGSGEVYFDSITMFIFFLTLGRFIEMGVRHRTTNVTDALCRHLPATAHRFAGNELQNVATSSLEVGDMVLVRAGEVLPADGVIVEGHTHIDEALLTGESRPVARASGAKVSAGAMNASNPIRMQVTAVGDHTVLSSIAKLLQRAQTQKATMARNADTAAALLLKYVLLGSIVVFVGWLFVDSSHAFAATLAVLIAACPCAFSIGTPAAIAAATSQLARHGILVIRVDAIEALANIKRCVFDKTGTLTRGHLKLRQCTVNSALGSVDALALAAALEQGSEHPIARAFSGVATLGKRATEVRIVQGRGIEGSIDGQLYRIGALQFVAELWRISVELETNLADDSVIVLGNATGLLATFELADELRAGGHRIAKRLQALGVHSEILSGDSHAAVEAIAYECGIDTFTARQLPEQKLIHVQSIQAQGEPVLMLGDGINDAPVLSASSVSVAMGQGAALAHASADIILIDERLSSLPRAILLARRTMRIANQNMFWAAAYNLTALPLAALGFLPPWMAAIGMSLSSIAVILNATRLLPAPRHTKRICIPRLPNQAQQPPTLQLQGTP